MIDHVEHDWNSLEYVDRWIAKDRARDATRRPVLRAMLKAAPFAADAALEVLDVAGGYGAVTDEVLHAFPNAKVTLHDFSQPMLVRARERFAAAGASVRCVQADLSDPGWAKAVGGPFDLVVSAIAIHNLREMATMAAIYRAIEGLLRPGGVFLDCDYFDHVGGLAPHLDAMRAAGFATVESVAYEPPRAIVRARKA